MTWQFYGGTFDPQNPSFRSMVFCIACQPEKILTMMSGLENLSAAEDAELPPQRRAPEEETRWHHPGAEPSVEPEPENQRRPAGQLKNPVGRKFKPRRYFDLERPGLRSRDRGRISAGPLDGLAAINCDYYNAALDVYPQSQAGQPHPMDTEA